MPRIGYKQTEEHRLKNKNRPNGRLGKLHSEESKNKMRIAGIARAKFTKEEREDHRRMHSRSTQRNARNAAVEALGGKCVRCGFDDSRALQIDHINGGGTKERRNGDVKGNFHKHVLQSFLKNENKYQLLCANCNWIKRSELHENRGYVKIEPAIISNSR